MKQAEGQSGGRGLLGSVVREHSPVIDAQKSMCKDPGARMGTCSGKCREVRVAEAE